MCKQGDCHGERHVMVVCTGEECRHKGARKLLQELEQHCAEAEFGGELRVGASRECIGHCVAAPAMVEDGRVMGWMSLQRLRFELGRLGLRQIA